MTVYDVYTDLDPDQLTEVAKETFRMWLMFALGNDTAIGKGLMNPTGRYAASISWKKTGVSRVSIIADEKIAPEAARIEDGADGHNMKVMLEKNAKIDAQGYRYRVIPIRPDGPEGPLSFNMNSVVGGAGGEKLPQSVGRVWAKKRAYVDSKSRFVTMRERSPGWWVPAMPAYAPAMALKNMLEKQYGLGS